MKNLIFINGTMGVGKTATSQELKKMLSKCVFLDGDWCWDMSPFIVNEETKAMVIDNITHLLNNFLSCSEFENIVFCWVMHEESIINDILSNLNSGYKLHEFSLVCDEDSLTKRINKDVKNTVRQADVLMRSLSRLKKYYKMNTIKIDVGNITAFDAAKTIFDKLSAVLETDRLILREITQDYLPSLCKILQDKDVMYAYEHTFSDEEVQSWLNNQISRYEKYGFGLWAVILKETNEMIGQCGLTMQSIGDKEVLEIGYLFQKAFWHKGYATESAIACKNYAFNVLNSQEVYSIIRDSNIASQNVAKCNGMTVYGEFTKHYYNMDMPHLLYCVKRAKQLDKTQ